MTPSELAAELRRTSEQATPGPWGHGEGPCGPYLDYQARPPENVGHEPTSDYDGREPLWLGGSVDAGDRALICLLRNNLPTILAALDRAAGPPPAPTYTREGKRWRADGFPTFRSTEAAGPAEDTERLDWLAQQGHPIGRPWIARESAHGRGYRLHQTESGAGHKTPRDAIDAARAAQKGAGR